MRGASFAKIIISVIISLLVIPVIMTDAADPFYNFVVTGEGRIQIPLTYSTETVMKGFADDNSTLDFAADIFIDDDDRLYILDNGNSRVLKYDLSEGKQVFIKSYELSGKLTCKNPNGLFADKDGDIYIADTDNFRVLHIGENGEFIEQFVQPESELYDQSIPFRPYKLGIDSLGQLYVLNFEDDNGFIIVDAYNEFRGYTAPTTVDADSLSERLVKLFATKEQREKIGKKNRPMHSNITFGDDNTFYVTTARAKNAQMKKYTSVGVNIYPKTNDFSVTDKSAGITESITESEFVDVCVDADGNASVLDRMTGYVTQYSPDGIMLTVFGGKGSWAGRFLNPVAIDCDSSGRIYVLDKDTATIQVFKPTAFIEKVHEALRLYNDGKYEESFGPLQEILKITDIYPVANIGLGKSYMKQERWEDALKAYRKNLSRDLYSEAFDQLRLRFVREHFGAVVISVISVIAAGTWAVLRLRKYARRIGGGR